MTETRPKHPEPELEELLSALEQAKWRVTKRPRGYFKAYCPCDEKHLKTVRITPNRNYRKNLISYLKRETCWEG